MSLRLFGWVDKSMGAFGKAKGYVQANHKVRTSVVVIRL
jgi:hypothetical protein